MIILQSIQFPRFETILKILKLHVCKFDWKVNWKDQLNFISFLAKHFPESSVFWNHLSPRAVSLWKRKGPGGTSDLLITSWVWSNHSDLMVFLLSSSLPCHLQKKHHDFGLHTSNAWEESWSFRVFLFDSSYCWWFRNLANTSWGW